jgi:RNA polymerase sigma factor (TIGR02999 family)
MQAAEPGEHEIAEVTQWLGAWERGDHAARERLFAWAYPTARAIAARRLAGRRDGDLSTTQVAHDSLLRLLERPSLYAHREHFLRVFAMAVRQQIIDHVRLVRSAKHGGAQVRVDAHEAADVPAAAEPGADYEDLYRALDELERHDARKRRVIELHYLLGFERSDIARLLDISVPTVDRDLAFARAWLKVQMGRDA